MKYTSSIAALSAIVLLAHEAAALPIDQSINLIQRVPEPYIPYEITQLESRNHVDVEKRSLQDWNQPSRISGFGNIFERPANCGDGGVRDFIKRDLSREVAVEIKRRSQDDGSFITNVQFSPE
jgi:hypothetical protein